MAQQVYTVRMWSLSPPYGIGTITGPEVPVGFVWVVRDVRALNVASSSATIASPLLLTSGGNLNIATTPPYGSVPGVLYHWQGRAVAAPGEFLTAVTQSPNWTLMVDGYQLSTP